MRLVVLGREVSGWINGVGGGKGREMGKMYGWVDEGCGEFGGRSMDGLGLTENNLREKITRAKDEE